jgi:sec-independent protein translocase protein TatC
MDERRMPFMEHIAELRKRILRAFLAVLVFAGVSFAYATEIIEFLKLQFMPAGYFSLHTFTLGEAFFQEIKVAIISGFFFAGPFIVYQIWAFIAPALYDKERQVVVPFMASAIGFFLAGAAFCFFIVLPFAVEFLVTYGAEHSTPVIQLSSFISFVLFFLLSFGLIFELPVVLYFLAKVGVVKSAPLRRIRRYAIVAFFVIGAILTPTPDVVNQSLMAVPMWILYELGILGVVRVEKQRAAREAADRAEAEAAREAASAIVEPGEGGS